MKREAGTEFTIDDSPHYAGVDGCCGLGVHKGCGGTVHRQAAWGPSLIYECDGCSVCEDGEWWMPETEDEP